MKKSILEKILSLVNESEIDSLIEMLNDLQKYSPNLTYHFYSMIPRKYNWPKERVRWALPKLLKKIKGERINLPEPEPNLFRLGLPETLIKRRSVRRFKRRPLTLIELSTLLYYSLGIKGSSWGIPMRMFPSAGALQPIEAYLQVNGVEGLEKGIYHYEPDGHKLTLLRKGDFSMQMYKYSLEQDHVRDAPLNIVLSIVLTRTQSKYGFRAYRYALLDTGHVGMNLYLVATSMGLGTCAVGAYYDRDIDNLFGLDGVDEISIIIYPIGEPK